MSVSLEASRDRLEELVNQVIKEQGVPGVAVGVLHEGETVTIRHPDQAGPGFASLPWERFRRAASVNLPQSLDPDIARVLSIDQAFNVSFPCGDETGVIICNVLASQQVCSLVQG